MSGFGPTLAWLPARLAANAPMLHRARRAEIALLLDAGTERHRLILSRGVLAVHGASGPMDDWDIALRATAEAWADHWAPLPRPDAFDIFGMVRHGRMRIEGNFLPLMRHLQVVKDILALPRTCGVGA